MAPGSASGIAERTKKRGASRPLNGRRGGRLLDSAAARMLTVATGGRRRADGRGFGCGLRVHVVGAGVEVRGEQYDAAVEGEGVNLDVEAGAVLMGKGDADACLRSAFLAVGGVELSDGVGVEARARAAGTGVCLLHR